MTQLDSQNHGMNPHRIGLIAILTVYLLLTIAYGILNPLFEAPDEHWHFFTAVYIAENKTLPFVAEGAYDEWLSQEAAQPPLYYIIGAALIAPIDTSQAREDVWLNPFARIGTAATPHNINLAVHGPHEAWPWRGYALAAHILRLFSTLLGLGTLLFIYGSGRLLWPTHPTRALLAMGMTAFLPQFNFIHAAVTNDALVTFLAAAAVWQLLRIWLQFATPNRILLLGITIGLTALTKNAGILLAIFALGVLAVQLFYARLDLASKPAAVPNTVTFRHLFTHLMLPILLIAGWLWLRNYQLYGDITATEPFIRIAGGDRNYTLGQVLAESDGLWLSLFGVFGWFNLLAPGWVYGLWNGIAAAAVLGAIWHFYKRDKAAHSSWITFFSSTRRLAPLILGGWFVAVYAGLIAFMLRTEAAQGRLLFPALVPLALALAFGLSQWGRWAMLLPIAALLTSLGSLLGVIRPAYALPPTISELPPTAVALYQPMGMGLTLVGAERETETAVPGDLVTYTLYWQAEAVPPDPPEFKLELLGQDLENPLAEIHSYHGRGLFPANLWPPNQLIADQFSIRVDADADVPVNAGVFLRLVDEDNPPEGVLAGHQKLVPAAWPQPPSQVLATFEAPILLHEAQLSAQTAGPGDTVTIDVVWQAAGTPDRAYTTLIHLAERGQPPLATGDSPPRQGTYPTTVWAAGEVFSDSYHLTLPPDLPDGRYPIWIGLYDSDTIVPLAVEVDGVRQEDGRVLIGEIEVR